MRPLALVGATASGKTAASLELARQVDLEIISMDSMALYRGAPILTAQPSKADRECVPHHLMACLEPEEDFSVADWVERVCRLIGEIDARGRLPLIVGGTLFYLQALREGLDEMPSADQTVRLEHDGLVERQGPEALYERLKNVDPEVAAQLHPNDTRRVSRALEVFVLTGQTRRERRHHQAQRMDVVTLGWHRTRDDLAERVGERCHAMVEAGLLDEIRVLQERPVGRNLRQAAGYEEMLQVLNGELAMDQALEKMATRTRRLVKHQQTWMKRIPMMSIDAASSTASQHLLDQAVRHVG